MRTAAVTLAASALLVAVLVAGIHAALSGLDGLDFGGTL